jgi:peptidoglycan/LPS O-acetylase OafA/YrhL
MTRSDKAVLATVRPPQPGTRLERTLGEISYLLYVLQMPVFTALILATQRFAPGLIGRAAPWLGIVALAAFSATIWIMATRWERPSRRRLAGRH